MEQNHREDNFKNQYYRLLIAGNAELSLLMTRCLIPVGDQGKVELDSFRLKQELCFYEYLQHKGEWSILALIIPLCLAQNHLDSVIEVGEKAGKLLEIKDSAALKWGLYLLGKIIFNGKIQLDDLIDCSEQMDTPQDNISFQRLRIQTLSHKEKAFEDIPLLLQDNSSFGRSLIENFLLVDNDKQRALDENHYVKMADYLWKVKNFNVVRQPLKENMQLQILEGIMPGQSGYLSILGEFEVISRQEEQGYILLQLKSRRGIVAIKFKIGAEI